MSDNMRELMRKSNNMLSAIDGVWLGEVQKAPDKVFRTESGISFTQSFADDLYNDLKDDPTVSDEDKKFLHSFTTESFENAISVTYEEIGNNEQRNQSGDDTGAPLLIEPKSTE